MAMRQKLIGGLLCGVAGLTIGSSAWAAYTGTPPLLVTNGGTGATTFTAHGVLLGEGTGAITATGVGTTGIPLVGVSGADPAFGTAVVGGGGTGATTLAANGVLVGAGTAAVHVVGSSTTADSTLQWGAAGSDPIALAVNNCTGGTNALTYSTTTHTYGCNAISAGGETVLTPVTGVGTTQTLATTNLSVTPSNITVSAVWSLPTIQANGYKQCLKDGTTNFGTFPQTVKPNPTTLTIDGIAGTTGVTLNQAHQELCFVSDGTNWLVE